MMNEEVRKIMTKNPEVAHPDENVAEVSQRMIKNRLQQLPVVEDGKLAGMITSYDLWRNADEPAHRKDTVRDVMTTRVIKIAPKDKVGTAAELFIDKRFKTLPVVNLRNELKGVITAFDVIKYIFKKEYPNPILYKEILEAED
jgi:CBS domain-containing protein